MRKRQLLFIVLCLLLWPTMSAAEEYKLFFFSDFRPSDQCFISGLPENRQGNLLSTPKKLTAQELDSITAGGLENSSIMMKLDAWLLGRIILWDELGVGDSTKHAMGPASALPACRMKTVRINAVFIIND